MYNTFHRLGEAGSRPTLHHLALLPHHLEQWLHEQRDGRIARLSNS
jgi:hypothetical protein